MKTSYIPSLCLYAWMLGAAASTPELNMTPVAPGPGNSLTGNGITLFGGDGYDDSRNSICDAQGACTLYGYTNKSFGDSTDYLIIHLMPSGAPDWARTYGGTNRDDLRYAVPANDKGALLVGMSQSLFYTSLKIFSPNKPPRPFLLRVDAQGNAQWAMTMDIDGVGSSMLQFDHGTQTPDGGFILAGIYEVGPSASMHAAGEKAWTWNGTAPDFGDKGYGTMALARLGADGHVVWLKRYSIPNSTTAAWGVRVDPDGHLLVLAHIAEKNNLLWVHLDADGHVLNAQAMTDPLVSGPELIPAPDGGMAVIAWSRPPTTGPGGLFAARYTASGEIKWAREYAYAAPVGSMDAAFASPDTLCVVGRLNGGDQSRPVAVALDATGNLTAALTFGETKPTELTGVSPLAHGQCLLVGDTADYGVDHTNLLISIWDPGHDQNGLAAKFTQTTFTPKLEPVTVVEATTDTKDLHLLPLAQLAAQTIQVPAVSGDPKK